VHGPWALAAGVDIGTVPDVISPVEFPTSRPSGYEWLPDEEAFDPAVHLELGEPEFSHTLADFGYSPADSEGLATDLAATGPFRILSDRGAAVLLESARRLRVFTRPASTRVENAVRGGCYRSRFLRDLCLSPEVTEAMSRIYGAPVAPHAMPVHLGHMNFEPTHLVDAVDKWHHDTIPLDYVMMVSDPRRLSGGHFEYFVGTKAEAAELAARGERPPADRVVRCEFPGPGWAVALHGNMVVHRGAPLDEPGERITMVNAYESLDVGHDLQCRTRDLIAVDDHEVLYAEWVRHVAWRARHRLAVVERDAPFGLDADAAVEMLERAVEDVRSAIDDMRAGYRESEHYEQRVDDR